jgi:uncharacterized protein YdeI (YjbR/CyaY-like superfamily)
MRADIVAGAVFPDYELTDHAGKRRKLSDLQGPDPMVLVLSRGAFCPKDLRQPEGLVHLYREMEGGYCRLVTISTDNMLTTNEYRTGVGAQVHAGRVMKFASAKDITAKAATIKAYVRQAIAVEKAGLRMKRKKTSDSPVPEELRERLRSHPRFKRAFEALTPGRQRSYLYHFAAAKQSATRVARIEKAMPAIFEGRGFLERR